MTMPLQPAIALPRWQRLAIYTTVALLVASGLGWLAVAWPGMSDISPERRAAAIWLLRVHGVAAYAVLIAVGSVLPVHLRLAWVRRRNRWSGALLVALFAGLALTGLWLYYGSDAMREIVSTSHWIAGLVLPVWLLLHRAWGLRARRA